MSARIERILAACLVLRLVGCGGDGAPSFVIENEHGSESAAMDITEVRTRPCLARFWSSDEPALGPTDVPAEGRVEIKHGTSHAFSLSVGCHDFVVFRGANVSANARVVLDDGETAHWTPFAIDDNESWWCWKDCDE